MTNKSFVRKLPGVFQTPSNKKFFSATVDQLYCKRDSDHLNGYIGRRVGNQHDPINDFYLPEPSKERTWRQLEPTVYSVDQDTLEKTNVTFYDDFVNFINQYGGNTGNHDRLFSTNSYSFAPPIDYDKFINYQNYFWIPDRLPVINIDSMDDSDVESLIIGQPNFNTDYIGASPSDLEFTSGLRVNFIDSTSYDQTWTVENVGDSMVLVEDHPDTISDLEYTLLAWDGPVTVGTTTWNNEAWDVLPWDAVKKPLGDDYITIERGAIDANAWSRSNKWYHIDTINAAVIHTTGNFPQNAVRAFRPIIEFIKDIELYKSGITFKTTVNYIIDDDYSTVNGETVGDVAAAHDIEILNGDLLIFPNDLAWNQDIYTVSIDPMNNEISLSPAGIPITDGDIVFATAGPYIGNTYYFDTNWILAANQKVQENQPPLYNLYDSDGTSISNEAKYPNNDFRGSEIFSYKINEDPNASNDSILGFPIVYKSIGTAADIVFENDLETQRYNYIQDNVVIEIDGYYYFRIVSESDTNDASLWNFNSSWAKSTTPTKQRVVDRYVVGFDAVTDYRISVKPLGFDEGVSTGDVEIYHDGVLLEISVSDLIVVNGDIYYQNASLNDESVIEIKTYTAEILSPTSRGYFEIPSQLESNPNNSEITEYSIAELSNHFVSIIANQTGFQGMAFGGPTNYRDTLRDGSEGNVIIQNESSLLRSMLVSSEDDLNLITAIRYSQNEYNKFKSKYVKTAQQLINRNFIPTIGTDDVIVDEWFEEIIKTITVSKEFSNSFAYSHMVARGDLFKKETFNVVPSLTHTLGIHANLSDPRNVLYLYKETNEVSVENDVYEMVFNNSTEVERLLVEGVDYIIQDNIDPNDPITIEFLTVSAGDTINARIYENSAPAYIPSTPSKVGCYPCYVPKMEYDDSYVNPTWVIIGHDGSRTPTYGDYDEFGSVINPDFRDNLILELERRIYNGIDSRFKDNYELLLKVEDIKSGRFRTTDYSLEEYLKISKPHFTKWATKNKVDFTSNDFYDAGDWRTWNYRLHGDPSTGDAWPGHWRGIYEFYYDTARPHLAPWEMLGFSIKPEWWDVTYINLTYPDYSSNNTPMWIDIEAGLVADGNGIPGQGTIDDRYVRTGMQVPVNSVGELIDIPSLFSITPIPPNGADGAWRYGDGAPVEQSWKNSSEYPYAIMEVLYLTRPAQFGEVLWNPSVLSKSIGGQLIDLEQNSRRKNENIYVHGENIEGNVTIKTGFEVFISDRLFFLGKNITEVFGEKVRSVDVNLGYRLAGYTNAETLRMFLDGSSPESISNSLQIPSNNYEVSIHTGPAVGIYNYSGVIIRVSDSGKYIVYGYDLLNLSFKIIERSNTSKKIQINEAGSPSDFTYFDTSNTYNIGNIVKYNSVFYEAITVIDSGPFNSSEWKKLSKLPTHGGVNVSYKPMGNGVVTEIPYGTVFDNIQDVFDFLISYGDYLESEGWVFEDVNTVNNQVKNWLTSAKEFLFWASSDWESNNALFLSPLADGPKLIVDRGYPSSVERLSNGVYSILDKNGIAILPSDTQIERNGQEIQINPKNLTDGIYYSRVVSMETEHIVLFDNTTDFNDTVYDPILGVRQNRLRFNGRKSNGWYGKFEANGYLIIDDKLVQNYDNLADSIRFYYDSDVQLDNTNVEDAARHLIGYEAKEYLTNLELVDDAQYQFYQGFVRDKGTQTGLTRILRSDFVQESDSTEIFEEWAFKLSEFGGTCEKTQIDFVINPSDVQSNPQIVRLNHQKSNSGYISEIKTFNSQDVYSDVPDIVVDPPTGSNPIQATAVAQLDENNKIGSIIMDNTGSGYESTPTVSIIRSDSLPVNDQVHAVYHPEISHDTTRDEIIDIDIDNNDSWLYLPQNCEFETMPTTEIIDYQLPNAGYVHKNDVDYMTFSTENVFSFWDSVNKPSLSDTFWIAKTINERFNVYVIDATSTPFTTFDNGTSPLTIEIPSILSPSSMMSMVDSSGDPYVVLFGTDINQVYATRLVDAESDVYNLLDADGTELVYDDLPLSTFNLHEIKSIRIPSDSDLSSLAWLPIGGKFWADSNSDGKWVVGIKTGVSSYDTHRMQEPLIDTNLFENAYLYDKSSKETIVRLPVYDPFKGLIPGRAEQNINYKTFNDPARYTDASEGRLIDNNRLFGAQEVGKLWWDLNAVRYMYYEQPTATGEDESHNLLYRRNHWGRIFPGSSIDVYEWIRSTVTPGNYNGVGTPKNTTDYVRASEFNNNLNQFITVYYYWVKNVVSIPNLPNRTLPAVAVANSLSNPRASGFEWFAPIKKSPNNDSYIFSNVDRIIGNIETVAQINYDNSPNSNEEHVQWKLLRENDANSVVPDHLWNKCVDSLVGTTGLVPLSEYMDAIPMNSTEGVLLVPDPTLGESLKYGNAFRPRQSMFVNILEARRVFVQVINRILSKIPIREYNEDWNSELTTNVLWSYGDWFEDGYDSSNTIASRQVATTADLTTIGDAYDGEIIKVLSFSPSPTERARYHVYVADGNYFGLVRIEAARIVVSNEIFGGSNTIALRNELRELLDAFKNTVLINDTLVGINELFFSLVNYSYSEQDQIDWAFKTSYIYLAQGQQSFGQGTTTYRIDPFENVKAYMQDAKPYRTKIRDVVSDFGNIPDELTVVAQDDAIGVFDSETNTWTSVIEPLRFMDIELDINRTECLIPEWCEFQGTILNAYKFNLDGWDDSPWDIFAWDSLGNEYDTYIDGSDFLETDYTYAYQGQNFPTPNGLPEDVVPVAPSENIVITVNNQDPTSTTEIEYKHHISPFGYVDYIRMSGVERAVLTAAIDKDSVDIEVDDSTELYNPSQSSTDYGIVWVGDERIEYYSISGNTLTNIKRGTLGTTITDHLLGDAVYDGTSRQEIPHANDEVWSDNFGPTAPPSGALLASTTVQAEFLKEKPIIS